jgi:twitching motility protein PilT
MSQLTPLLAKLKASGADRVFFAPNDHGYALDGEAKRQVPGGPVHGQVLLAAVSELLSHDDITDLSSTRPRIVRHEHDGEDFVLEIVRHGAGVALGIRQAPRANRPAPKPAPAAAKPRLTRATPNPARLSKRLRGASQRPPAAGPAPAPAPVLGSDKRTVRAEVDEEGNIIEASANPPLELDRGRAISLEDRVNTKPQVPTGKELDAARAATLQVQPPVVPVQPVRSGPPRIDRLLKDMLERKASDLHLSANSPVVLRVDGEIHFGSEALSSAAIAEMMAEIMTERARSDYANLHDADFAYEIAGLARFRVNVFTDRHGTGAVLRQIPIEILSAEKLGLPKACLDMCWLSKGLVLVTGPTGSGKSTTLAAMIDFINRNRSDHIITIEDPVEFVHKNQKCLVNQREVGQHTMSFKNALRAALREDPDIVLVGEMRDLETISIAIETAETGHLVFGTLHTTTAVSTVDRIIDQFPSDRQDQIRVMLSESLKGVVAQILCPKIGGGRVAAHEILLGTSAVAAMVREGKTFQLTSVMQTSKGQGMVTMNDSLLALVQKKLVDPKQAYIKAVDKNGLLTQFKNAGIPSPI